MANEALSHIFTKLRWSYLPQKAGSETQDMARSNEVSASGANEHMDPFMASSWFVQPIQRDTESLDPELLIPITEAAQNTGASGTLGHVQTDDGSPHCGLFWRFPRFGVESSNAAASPLQHLLRTSAPLSATVAQAGSARLGRLFWWLNN